LSYGIDVKRNFDISPICVILTQRVRRTDILKANAAVTRPIHVRCAAKNRRPAKPRITLKGILCHHTGSTQIEHADVQHSWRIVGDSYSFLMSGVAAAALYLLH